ncbi:MAG: hypothetical protein KKF44_02990 [Nanoarchaeota archaeon]|nr:hypothetical protein [Nanoarchaeota archaeon]
MNKNKKQAREKRNKLFLSIVTIMFLTISLGGVVLYNNNGTNDNYVTLTLSGKDYRFTRFIDDYGQNKYSVDVDNTLITAYYLPTEVDNIKIDREIIAKIKDTSYFFFTFDPYEEDLSYIEFLRFDLTNNFQKQGKFLASGVTQESTTYPFPIINCENATQFSPVIIFSNSNITSVSMDNNCIHIDSRATGFIKVRDKIIYSLYGLI